MKIKRGKALAKNGLRRMIHSLRSSRMSARCCSLA
jgi:hypothetical protein